MAKDMKVLGSRSDFRLCATIAVVTAAAFGALAWFSHGKQCFGAWRWPDVELSRGGLHADFNAGSSPASGTDSGASGSGTYGPRAAIPRALPAPPLAAARPLAITDPAAHPHRPLSAMAQLGKDIFFDRSLSGSGRISCASCHSPDHAYGPPDGRPAQFGGIAMNLEGARAVPSLRYLDHNPTFTIGAPNIMPDTDSPAVSPAAVSGAVAAIAKSGAPQTAPGAPPAPVPQGGFDWDGRANSLQEQAVGPLLDPHEMANRNLDVVTDKLRHAGYAKRFIDLFGPNVMNNPGQLIGEALFALGRYQAEDVSFHPYDSKYDWYLAGKAQLSAQEMHGLKLFEDPAKGNCAACHIDRPSRDGIFPAAFTDYQFEALGVPRNRALAQNRDPHHFDLGLCGPARADYRNQKNYCGLFKTPTLRNVATRRVFFHNGVFHTLTDVLHWYVERDTDPRKWYPAERYGAVHKYDDLPPQYRANIDVVDAPLDRKPGQAPALNDAEIADVIAFLNTLTDGYRPDGPVGAKAGEQADPPPAAAASRARTAASQ
ncbi:cytochrome c peroxidase [Paraburkholderia sp. SARCC-3016]|uniref:cytochrome-c peroxidase n=1 Tax=Paraburkholderia sp. SARCC-3016 TaxID=3058611 RepID=UPI002807A77A|nr:cytochrome c peroxidase [Paraburkholderia sp. SARCC-3016]MDQ7980846.1 cytochrome c peroxidase [Paraburkholderia sp. SARCC-3016]